MSTVLAFLVTIAILVAVHEWGHYRMARACGVRVLRFSIGFGRVLWRRQTDPQATEWVVCALPLGGYVRMLDSREDEVPADQRHLAFDHKPLLHRSLIVAAGPVANLVLAVVLYAAAAWMGTQEPLARLAAPVAGTPAAQAGLQSGDRVTAVCRDAGDGALDAPSCVAITSLGELHWQLTTAVVDRRSVLLELAGDGPGGRRRAQLDLKSLGGELDEQVIRRIGLSGPFAQALIGRVIEGGAAQAAGLREGDRVLSVDGQGVPDAGWLRERIRQSLGTAEEALQVWRIEREGRVLELEVRPRPARAADGQRIGRVEAMIGVSEMVLVRKEPAEALAQGWNQAWEMSWLTVRMIGRMLIGEASIRQLSGPLTIADAAGQSAERGAAQYLGFLALVSVSLFVLNLLPLPMLDGGHLMYHLFEALTGRPPTDAWLSRLQRIGVAALLMLMALALTNDVVRLLGPN